MSLSTLSYLLLCCSHDDVQEEAISYIFDKGGGGAIPKTNEIVKNICSCHNFFPLSSVQIIIIPACCLLCVL